MPMETEERAVPRQRPHLHTSNANSLAPPWVFTIYDLLTISPNYTQQNPHYWISTYSVHLYYSTVMNTENYFHLLGVHRKRGGGCHAASLKRTVTYAHRRIWEELRFLCKLWLKINSRISWSPLRVCQCPEDYRPPANTNRRIWLHRAQQTLWSKARSENHILPLSPGAHSPSLLTTLLFRRWRRGWFSNTALPPGHIDRGCV